MSKNLFNVLLVSMAVGLYYLAINPLYTGIGMVWQPKQGIGALRALDTQYADALSQAEELYAQAETLSTEYGSIDDELKAKMKVMVPDDIDPVKLLSEVNGIANQQGVGLSDLRYTKNGDEKDEKNMAQKGGSGYYTVAFSASTNYAKMKDLLESLETSLRLFTVTRVTLKAPTDGGSLNDFEVELKTYYIQ